MNGGFRKIPPPVILRERRISKIKRSFASLRMTKRHLVSSSKHLLQGEANFFPLATTCNFLTGHRWDLGGFEVFHGKVTRCFTRFSMTTTNREAFFTSLQKFSANVFMTRVRIYDKNVKRDGAGGGPGLVKASWGGVWRGQRDCSARPPGPYHLHCHWRHE